MTIRSAKKLLFLPLLALSMTLATTVPAQAQGTSGSLQISFGNTPRWTGIPGSRVRVIRERERPNYDMFQYGGSYYVYQNDRWYSSRRARGNFVAMDERRVPQEISRVPRSHWRSYPAGWTDRDRNNGRGQDNRNILHQGDGGRR
jgi:hypothetical protein